MKDTWAPFSERQRPPWLPLVWNEIAFCGATAPAAVPVNEMVCTMLPSDAGFVEISTR
jgi:hypothetical protein